MKRLSAVALIISIFFMGCSTGFVNMEATLKEEPFAVETMSGNVTESINCVGQYWKKSVLPKRVWWKINPESLPILASGVGVGTWQTPVSLVINFNEVDGKTIARSYLHRSFSSKDERRTVAIDSLNACRDNSLSYYGGVKAIVLTTGAVVEGQILSIDHDELRIRTKDGRILFFSFMKDIKQYIMK